MPPDRVRMRTDQQRQGPHINALTPESRGFCKKCFKAFLSTLRSAVVRRDPRPPASHRVLYVETAEFGFANANIVSSQRTRHRGQDAHETRTSAGMNDIATPEVRTPCRAVPAASCCEPPPPPPPSTARLKLGADVSRSTRFSRATSAMTATRTRLSRRRPNSRNLRMAVVAEGVETFGRGEPARPRRSRGAGFCVCAAAAGSAVSATARGA